MVYESVEAFIARGGEIQKIPIGVSAEGVKEIQEYSWGTKTLTISSSSPKQSQDHTVKKPLPKAVSKAARKAPKTPVGDQKTYLDYIKANPLHRRREIAIGLNWSREKVSCVRSYCVDNRYIEPTKVTKIRTRTKKQCSGCNKLLLLNRFNKNKSKHDGLQNQCSFCQAEKMKKMRAAKKLRLSKQEI
tara:strand:+ start:3806 stop:4369 length:564 start_codon:yes stop_codon:yes gene_type:complete